MTIYDQSDNVVLDVLVDDKSCRNRNVMGNHNLILYFSLSHAAKIPVGSYCEFDGERYTLMCPDEVKMQHTRQYDYTVTFESEQGKTKIWKCRNTVDGRLKFSLTAKPIEHLQMVVDNLNRREPGWTIGECIDDVETLITYDHDYCIDALRKQATTFDTEYEIDGKTISLHKVEYNKGNPLPLSYGRGNGFKSGIGRSNSGDSLPVEILYVQGGERNIDRSKYPADETLRATSSGNLLLPVGQTIGYDGEHFEDEDGYNADNARHYVVDDLGLSIRNTSKTMTFGAEDSLDRSEDYPKRVGKVTRLDEVDAARNLYDIIDLSIPADLNYKDYIIGNETMTMIFQSGMLAGREFDVKYHHEGIVGKDGRRFEIVPQEIDGIMMPGGDFVPQVGDTYAIFNVMLPTNYICHNATKSGASWDMFRAAVKHLFDKEETKCSFKGELDGIWAKANWVNIGAKIRPGGYIRFTDDQIAKDGVLVRITNIKDYVNNPHSPKIELSNETVGSGVSSTLKQLESTEVIIEDNHRSALQFTKRRFRDAKETIEMLESALSDNFTNRINPIAVETMSMLVGDERLQFHFVSTPGATTSVPHNITWDSTTRRLYADGGTIQHLTLGINSIKPSHTPEEYHYWSVEPFESAILDDANVRYYLYICAEKTDTIGAADFRLETAPHNMEADECYWFLVGVLNSEYEGARSFVTLYGFTEILPGRITADRLITSDGDSYFDMLNAALKLKDKLQYNVNGDGQLHIKGALVQSQGGGTSSPMACYRGVYSNEVTYYNGDEVLYDDPSSGSTASYRCYSPAPITGVVPTVSTKWQVTATGAPGKYTEIRYQTNGSASEAPLVVDGDEPYGWTIAMPRVLVGQYLWQITAIKDGTGALAGSWSTPIRITPVDGKQGETGYAPIMLYRGPYDPQATYYGTTARVDCVKYGDAYYVTRTDAPGGDAGFVGRTPTETASWNLFGASFESIATGLLLAENANIANLIFRNQRLESTARSEVNGILQPNFFIDGLKNVASFAGGRVLFDQTLAKIAWLQVVEDELIGYDSEGTPRLIITPGLLPDANYLYEGLLHIVNYGGDPLVEVSVDRGEMFYGEYDAHQTMRRDENGGETLEDDAEFTCWCEVVVPAGQTSIDLSGASVNIQAHNLQGNSVTPTVWYGASVYAINGNEVNYIGGRDLTTGETIVNIPQSGRVRIALTARVDYPGYEWQGMITLGMQGLPYTVVRKQIILASDGIMSIYNGNYMRMQADSGFEVKVGNFGFRVSSTGLQHTANGATWESLFK